MIVHIGYHKTGSTYLQNRIFPFFFNVKYSNYTNCVKLFRAVCIQDEEGIKEVQSEIDKKEFDFFSAEQLVGEMGFGEKRFLIADTLKSLGFKKILITIRSQEKLIESVYKQYVHQGGTKVPNAYFDDSSLFNFDYFDYFSLIDYYKKLFGEENVLVLLQEELKNNEQNFMFKFEKFSNYRLDIEEKKRSESVNNNKSLSYISIILLRFINRFTYNYYSPRHLISKRITTYKFRVLFSKLIDPVFFNRIYKKRKFVDKVVLDKLEAKCRISNQKLQNRYIEDLKEYGYFLK